MKIALLAPPWYSVPPRAYGGIESLVAGLADGLTRRGHDVLLLSAGPSTTTATGYTTLSAAADDRLGDETTALLHATMAEDAIRDFDPDVVHDHTLTGLSLASYRSCPTVTTVHGAVTGDYAELLRRSPDVHLVAISEAQRRTAPDLPWAATVHNGIPVSAFPFSDTKDDVLVFLGRMHPDKGIVQAIDVAERSDLPLVIAARVHGGFEERYFADVVRPRLSSHVEFAGELNFADKTALLGRARALLFPLQWPEPYGLVVSEAQACGTPVLSLRRGAVPELVVEGRTALLRDHHLDLVADVPHAALLSPLDARQHAIDHLDIAATAAGYEALFERLVAVQARRTTHLRTSVA